ncbi:hypothetical protein RHSIM_Rhsim05G0015500 [Rhododendron simsii]|uniref:RING-type E3 ubiquitin transferase n=1 Tax=Rhododendron simsii TaxID=118357 RepID=A0A834H243_RHOSS|nr:hypothetical protein RHSIM_Rhsim05G0015500 [Rhododendron simsii]
MTTTVAVAVKGGGGSLGESGSRWAVQWAVENLMPDANPGDAIPIEQLDAHEVETYMQDTKLAFQDIFLPFTKLCKGKGIETLILEGDNPASALLKYVTDFGVSSLVLGSCSSSFIARKVKDYSVTLAVQKNAPETCKIYVVPIHKLLNPPATPLSIHEKSSRHRSFNQRGSSSLPNYEIHGDHYYSSVDREVNDIASSVSVPSDHCNSIAIGQQRYPNQNLASSILEIEATNEGSSVASTETKQSDVQTQVEELGLEDLVLGKNEVPFLSSKSLEEARQVNAALKREEIYKKIAAEGKSKHSEAMKEIETARNLFPKEAYERHIAEMKDLKQSVEKKKTMDPHLSNERRYKTYTRDEIEMATDSFSETKMIGEGSYWKLYRCDLDQTPVAVKVLHSYASEKKKKFLTEIEVLSQLRHPHIVLLLGACPETGCLVYEYMENGSLEDFLSHQSSRDLLPWFVRFRIAFEVARGLAFLHNTKPDPIIHLDLQPGNIFLGRNYVSKIGDVGLAKLVPDVAPDDITEYRDSSIVGSLHYVDPEYYRTGTIQPKSDLYAFGIIVLQLLSIQHPDCLSFKFEMALSNGSLSDILDKSIPDWPLAEAQELAQMALRCSRLQCTDRPDLETEVLPLLKKLAYMANATPRVQSNSIHAPNEYFCPILQEIMEDPYIAADGFTYEHRAIKAWLDRHSLSPVTKLRLQHKVLIQNHTLRRAIEDWRSRITSSSG